MHRFAISSISLVYLVAFSAVLFVFLSIFGSLVGSFTEMASIGTFTLGNYGAVFLDPRTLRVVGETALLGIGSVAFMMAFSIPIAWLLSRTDFPFKGATMLLMTAQLALPGFIVAMSYVWLFNPTSGIMNAVFAPGRAPFFDVYSLWWICFLQGLTLTPACVFMIFPAFQNLGSTLEEAAWANGVSPVVSFRRIVIPLLAPSVLAATLFFFVVSVEIFDFVGLIGLPARIDVLSISIYNALHPAYGVPDYGMAATAGVVLFAMAAIAIAIYAKVLRNARRFAVITGKSQATRLTVLGRWKLPAVLFVGLWMVLAFLIPLVTLVWVACLPYLQVPSASALDTLSLDAFRFAFRYLGEPLRNTLQIMAGAVFLALVWSVSISWVVTRSRSAVAPWVDGAVFLSLAVPSMVAAVAFQYVSMSIYQWVPLYGTTLLIAIAMGTRMLAFCTRTINGTALQIHQELDEAAQSSGVSRIKTLLHVFLPLILPSVAFSGVMVAMLSARELTLPLLMNAGQSPVISTLIFDLQAGGSYNIAAAISLYMIVTLLVLVLVAYWIATARHRGDRAGLTSTKGDRCP